MKLPLPLLITAEKAIAAVLRMDPDTQSRLSDIDGKVIKFNVVNPQFTMLVSVADGHVSLDQPLYDEHNERDDVTADTTISGSLRNLRSLMNSNEALFKGAVKIEGDIGVSHQLKEIVARLDPDWQDAVSPYLGDGITHRLDMFQSGFTRWLKRTGDALRMNTGEYLQEEVELVAAESQVRVFSEDVDEVRAAADRLDARIRQLEKQALGSQEAESQEAESQEAESQGTASQGTASQGTASQGTASQGTRNQGANNKIVSQTRSSKDSDDAC